MLSATVLLGILGAKSSCSQFDINVKVEWEKNIVCICIVSLLTR